METKVLINKPEYTEIQNLRQANEQKAGELGKMAAILEQNQKLEKKIEEVKWNKI